MWSNTSSTNIFLKLLKMVLKTIKYLSDSPLYLYSRLQVVQQNIINEEKMASTPSSLKEKRRFKTTVDQSERITTRTMAELLSQKEDLSILYHDIDPLRQKLFESRNQLFHNEGKIHQDPEKVQREYRKKMINFLDEKFLEAQKSGNGEEKLKDKKCDIQFSSEKNTDQIRTLFKEYLSILRQWNIKTLSQYWVGVTLKELHFIRNMLEERDLISEIWKHLKSPTWIELFVFIIQLYFHKNTHKNSVYRSYIKKNELISSIVQTLKEEGHSYNQKFIEKVYDSTCSSSLSYSSKLRLLNNRQNRSTFCSWYRQTSRRKG